MFASLDQPLTFLLHDITFHRAIARASHNPILASLIEMVSAMFYEQRKANVGAPRDLREAAEMHRADLPCAARPGRRRGAGGDERAPARRRGVQGRSRQVPPAAAAERPSRPSPSVGRGPASDS